MIVFAQLQFGLTFRDAGVASRSALKSDNIKLPTMKPNIRLRLYSEDRNFNSLSYN